MNFMTQLLGPIQEKLKQHNTTHTTHTHTHTHTPNLYILRGRGPRKITAWIGPPAGGPAGV